ncbi:MAG TPA: hypothetical protein VGR21_04090 [Cryptosporangiaceae bacterium]|nr:hypothetical protein [Cryptosporangiaceae bacterium]
MFRPFDPRARHLRRLRRRRSMARGAAVWAATIGGAAAVVVPYAGLGWLDVVWAGAAGGSGALAVLRWRDYRGLLAEPVPPPPAPSVPGRSLGQRVAPLAGPTLGPLLNRPKRVAVPAASGAAPAARRLNQAARSLSPIVERLGPHAGDTARDAHGAHRALRGLAVRITAVEHTIAVSPVEAHGVLLECRDVLVTQFAEGVQAYERLVVSAAECVAATARGGDMLAVRRLNEASDALAGLAQGLAEMTEQNTAYGLSG